MVRSGAPKKSPASATGSIAIVNLIKRRYRLTGTAMLNKEGKDMGVYRRHAIVVVGNRASESKITAVHAKAAEIFPWVSPISPPQTQGEMSFFIPPDGSAEAWPESDEGDARRTRFMLWLQSACLADDWVEVCFGEDMPKQPIVRAKNYAPESGESAW